MDAFQEMSERMGYWLDFDAAYRTMDPAYVESVWWSLKQVHAKGLLVQDHRVTPYCPRCGTALSDHEVAQGYLTVTDPSVYVRFPVTSGDWAGRASLLVWTTTPWTLVSNTAVAAHPDVTYVAATDGTETLIVAEPLAGAALGDGWTVVDRFSGRTLEHVTYRRPFDLVDIPDAHYVGLATYVTTEDGTGLVHQAPAFGADDLAVARRYGLPVVNPVRPGRHVRPGRAAGRRAVLQGRGRAPGRRPDRARAAVPPARLRARLPALLALRHPTPVLRAAVLVRPDHRGEGPPAGRERAHELVPGPDQARPLRRLAREQHRLGAVPQPVLGHPAAGLGVPGRPPDLRRVTGRARRAGRARPVRARPAPSVRGRGHPRLPGVRRDGNAGAGGDRRLVRLRVDAVRPVGRPAPQPGRVRGGVPGPVHLRGDRPDPGLVLLADGGRDAGVRPVVVRERALPRPHPRRRGPQDEQAPRQRARPDGADGAARRRRGPLVHAGQRFAVVGPAGRRRGGRRGRPQGAAHLLEHRVVPGALRARGRLVAGRAGSVAGGGAAAAGPVGAVPGAPGGRRRGPS